MIYWIWIIKRLKIKASKVLRQQKLDMNIDNFYNIIINNSNRDRLLSQKEIMGNEFDCNIQQVKTKLFDYLIYLLFFKDVIEIFQISKRSILRDKNIMYSDKQHRGNVGEGQFHINNRTYKHHKNKYFIDAITYEDLMKESKSKSKN